MGGKEGRGGKKRVREGMSEGRQKSRMKGRKVTKERLMRRRRIRRDDDDDDDDDDYLPL